MVRSGGFGTGHLMLRRSETNRDDNTLKLLIFVFVQPLRNLLLKLMRACLRLLKIQKRA
jgi:hypothetical protein